MDKLKAIFRRKKQEPGPSKTAGTRTEAPNQVGTSTQVPPPTTTTSSAAPSSSQPVAPAGAAPITTESSIDNPKPADPTPGAVPSATQAGSAQKDEAAAVAAK